jgi:hypothetical protein
LLRAKDCIEERALGEAPRARFRNLGCVSKTPILSEG